MTENMKKMLDILREKMHTDAQYRAFVEDQAERLRSELKVPGVTQPDDTTEWWHICEGRLSNVAPLVMLTEDDTLRTWLHDAAMWITRQSADAWIGPFFRKNFRTNPPKGTLETAHICRALAPCLIFCPYIFSDSEKEEIRTSLREKGIAAIDEWIKPLIADPTLCRSNWCIAEVGAAMAACVAIEDREKLRSYIPFFNELHDEYNSDFYGEPVGYWFYPCENFLSARIYCDWAYPELIPEMADIQIVIRPFIWAYYHRQGYFLLQNIERRTLRSMTFGDCNTMMEVRTLPLIYIAVYHEDPRVRALSSAMYEELYTDPETGRHSSIVGMGPLMLFPLREKANGDASFLPPSRLFGDGFLMYKDSWKDPKIQIAVQTGVTEKPHVIGHRHADHLSFQLAKDGIVILDDPSRCCYRLKTQKLCESASWHSLPSFTTDEEKPRRLEQRVMEHECAKLDIFDRLRYAHIGENGFTASSEAGELYPGMNSVRRSFAAAGENVLVIVDDYKADVPVFETASFLGNNRRREMKWHFTEDSAVMTREGVGVVIKSMQPMTPVMDYAALHDYYSISPDSLYQGREGSGYLVRMKNKISAAEGRSVYVIFVDREENLNGWNAEMADGVITVACGGEEKYRFLLDGEEIEVQSR